MINAQEAYNQALARNKVKSQDELLTIQKKIEEDINSEHPQFEVAVATISEQTRLQLETLGYVLSTKTVDSGSPDEPYEETHQVISYAQKSE